MHRWTNSLIPGLRKGAWSDEEDIKLSNWVKTEGANKWSQCGEYIGGRNGKQCRERWFNILCPEIKKGSWTIEEDYLIFSLYDKIGGKWSRMQPFFKGRTENSIKNRFYCALRKEGCNTDIYNQNKVSILKAQTSELLRYYDASFAEKQRSFIAWAERNNKGGKAYVDNVEEMLISTVFREDGQEQRSMNNFSDDQAVVNNFLGDSITKVNILNVDEKINEFEKGDFLLEDDDMRNVEEKIENFFNEFKMDTSSAVSSLRLEGLNLPKRNAEAVNTACLLQQLEMMEKWIRDTKKQLVACTENNEFEREIMRDNEIDFNDIDLFRDNEVDGGNDYFNML